MPKRYLLYEADADLSDKDLEELARILEGRHGKLKVISVAGNARAAIVKTTGDVALRLRGKDIVIRATGRRLSTVLTSGAIGNLKRRARKSGTTDNGEIPER